MTSTRNKPTKHDVIESEADLELRDPHDPAYLLISAVLVPGIWTLEHGRTMTNDTGELLRGLELALVGIAEPDTRCMVSGLNQAVKAMNRLIVAAQALRDELTEEVETEEGEDDDGNDRLN